MSASKGDPENSYRAHMAPAITRWYVSKIPEKSNLNEEKFILPHGCIGFSSWSNASINLGPQLVRTWYKTLPTS
jgi:hypothetical protein